MGKATSSEFAREREVMNSPLGWLI